MLLGRKKRDSNAKVTHLNAGLAIKKYWNKFAQLTAAVRQLGSQARSLQAMQPAEQKRSSTAMSAQEVGERQTSGGISGQGPAASKQASR